jgi:hypothetical protein
MRAPALSRALSPALYPACCADNGARTLFIGMMPDDLMQET